MIVIRHNPGMTRELWWEQDKMQPEELVLVLRQTKYNKEGGALVKEFRLTTPEVTALARFINSARFVEPTSA